MAAKKFVVTGDQYRVIDRRMREIKRQLDQEDGSPLEPEWVARELQKVVEGQGNAEEAPRPVTAVTPQFAISIGRVPADGVEFELTLKSRRINWSRYAVQASTMVAWDEFDEFLRSYRGSDVVTPQTHRFKLIRVGDCANLDEVREKLEAHGAIPEGHWFRAFRKTYRRNDGQGPIGIADASWSIDSTPHFPILRENEEVWSIGLCVASRSRGKNWRWLVKVG